MSKKVKTKLKMIQPRNVQTDTGYKNKRNCKNTTVLCSESALQSTVLTLIYSLSPKAAVPLTAPAAPVHYNWKTGAALTSPDYLLTADNNRTADLDRAV